jgi:hypothetical protein
MQCSLIHCISLHIIAFNCISLHFSALHCISWRFIALHCIALHCIALLCFALLCFVSLRFATYDRLRKQAFRATTLDLTELQMSTFIAKTPGTSTSTAIGVGTGIGTVVVVASPLAKPCSPFKYRYHGRSERASVLGV